MNNLNRLTSSVIVVSLFFTQIVIAKESIVQLEECVKISQDTARLACFDKITKKFSSKSIEANTTQVITQKIDNSSKEHIDNLSSKSVEANTAQVITQQVDDFSKEHIEKTAEEKANEVLSISLTVDSLKKVGRGQWKITFKNGQQWQQKDTTKFKLKEGNKVTLTKGALGSVFLQKENNNKRMKVKRLK
jgi:hypothetical protein